MLQRILLILTAVTLIAVSQHPDAAGAVCGCILFDENPSAAMAEKED